MCQWPFANVNTAVAGRGSRAIGFSSMSESASGSNRTSTGTSATIPPAAARASTASPVMRHATHVSPRGLPVAAAAVSRCSSNRSCWRRNSSRARATCTARPKCHSHRAGTTVVLKEGAGMEVLATNALNDPIDASPAAVGRELFLRGEKYLYCVAGRD